MHLSIAKRHLKTLGKYPNLCVVVLVFNVVELHYIKRNHIKNHILGIWVAMNNTMGNEYFKEQACFLTKETGCCGRIVSRISDNHKITWGVVAWIPLK